MVAVGARRIVAGAWSANCWVAAGAGGDAVIVDPGGSAGEIAARVAADRLRVRAVLATHGHHDHVSAAAELAELYEAPFVAHSADTLALERVNFHRLAFGERERVAVPRIDVDLATVADLRCGDLEIASIHTPGHTPGSVCFEIAGRLFTGDTLLTDPGARLPEFDRDALRASVRRIAETHSPDTVVHPGHGAPCTLGEALAALPEVCT